MVGDYDGNDGGDLFCAAVGKSGGKIGEGDDEKSGQQLAGRIAGQVGGQPPAAADERPVGGENGQRRQGQGRQRAVVR